MCGLAALFQPGRTFDPELLDGADRDLFHRGPDSGGRLSEPGLALVFRRLSIMDVSDAGDQPMTDPSGRVSLVFNGEIYNYPELRGELEAKGETFRTGSDTEAILLGYLAWGEGVLQRLEGMFALAIVDRREARALVARDPYGIKPLYMRKLGDLTAFSSEMRVLTRLAPVEPDERALAELITFGWAAGGLSNLKDIERVPGGTVFSIDLASGEVKRRRFFDVLDLIGDEEAIDEAEALRLADEAVKRSVASHLMSDVGYTLELSGGVDSSLIAALAVERTDWRIRSFSVKLRESSFDESEYRKEVTARYDLDHAEHQLGNKEFADAFEKAVWHMEGPVAHMGCVMIMMLCEKIREASKVVLTGEGADEFFGGYERFGLWKKLAWQERLARLLPCAMLPNRPPFMGIRRFRGLDAAAYASVYHDFRSAVEILPDLRFVPGAREKAGERFQSFIHRLFAIDQTSYLESLLVRQDKMSMAHSIEARVPFVHLPLARVLNRIPREVMAPGGVTKPLLKKIAEPYFSHGLLYRRKVGLKLPVLEWLSDENGMGRYLEYLTDGDSRLAAYGDRKAIIDAVERYRAGARAGMDFLLRAVNVEIWLRQSERLARPAA